MNIHQSPPTKWVPLTDEIVRSLEGPYLTWIIDLTEIRERFEALRDECRLGWKAPPELSAALDDINERDELYAAKHMDVARAYLAATEADATATKPQRLARIEHMKEALGHLRYAWEHGWQDEDIWTPGERNEIIWLLYCNPEFKNLFAIAERNTIYFCQKYQRLFEKREAERWREAQRLHLGTVPRLGPKLLGRNKRKRK